MFNNNFLLKKSLLYKKHSLYYKTVVKNISNDITIFPKMTT